MEIETFVRLAEKQYAYIEDCSELDGYFLYWEDRSYSPRQPRRGWTRADLRRREEMETRWLPSIDNPHGLPSVHPEGYRRSSNRVKTSLRMFDFQKPIVDATRIAIDECKRITELNGIATSILTFSTTHLEWLDWMASGKGSDVNTRWEIESLEMNRILRAIGLFAYDFKEAEWNRWLSLCSTAKRKELLDIFWLAKQPLSKSQIDPNAGSGLRRMIGEINELAAKADPFVPWSIRADQTTQKWEKHWFGG